MGGGRRPLLGGVFRGAGGGVENSCALLGVRWRHRNRNLSVVIRDAGGRVWTHAHMCACTPVSTHVFSLLCQPRGLRCSNIPAASSPSPGPRSQFLTGFSSRRNQGSLEKWLILGLGQRTSQRTCSSLSCQESVSKLQARPRHKRQPKGSQRPRLEQFEQ